MELGVAFGFTFEPSAMFYEAGLEPSFTTLDEVAPALASTRQASNPALNQFVLASTPSSMKTGLSINLECFGFRFDTRGLDFEYDDVG